MIYFCCLFVALVSKLVVVLCFVFDLDVWLTSTFEILFDVTFLLFSSLLLLEKRR
jgi:hypothetical protein